MQVGRVPSADTLHSPRRMSERASAASVGLATESAPAPSRAGTAVVLIELRSLRLWPLGLTPPSCSCLRPRQSSRAGSGRRPSRT